MAILNESFTATDNNDIELTDTDLTWNVLSNDMGVQSNQVGRNGTGAGGSFARAEHNLASDDHYAEMIVNAFPTPGEGTNRVGVCVRMNEGTGLSTLRFYFLDVRKTSAGAYSVRLERWFDGTETALVTATPTEPTAPFPVRLEAEGDNIRGLVDGVEVVSAVDTQVAGFTKGGIWLLNRTTAFGILGDDWEAGDLAAAGTVSPGLIDQSGQVFAPQINHRVEPALLDQQGVLFAPSIAQLLAVGLIDQSGQVFAPTITGGDPLEPSGDDQRLIRFRRRGMR